MKLLDWRGTVLYSSSSARTNKELVEEAVRSGVDLAAPPATDGKLRVRRAPGCVRRAEGP